jgi:hypothetical protein
MNFAPPPRAYGEISFGARLAGIFDDLFFFFFLVTFHIFSTRHPPHHHQPSIPLSTPLASDPPSPLARPPPRLRPGQPPWSPPPSYASAFVPTDRPMPAPRRLSVVPTAGRITEADVVEQYHDVFNGRLGLLKGDVHLEVDPNVPPIQMPIRGQLIGVARILYGGAPTPKAPRGGVWGEASPLPGRNV